MPDTHPDFGSYAPDDCVFLLTDISHADIEADIEQRERQMQGSGHYSESLPIEYRPTPEYEALFHRLLAERSREMAVLSLVLAEVLLREKPTPTLVSLARAGTPVGVLLRRALAHRGVEVRHYTISIIRDRGIDHVALRYLLERHRSEDLVFVDGWTGKGVIARELTESLAEAGAALGARFDDRLAVLADPGWATPWFATREDVIIPSACLNSTVSGLISRTVLRDDLIGPDRFHGAKMYREFADVDVSVAYVDAVCAHFETIEEAEIAGRVEAVLAADVPDLRGLAEVERIQAEFSLPSINLVKPGIGETTRVLLRRRPWKVLYKPSAERHLVHIRQLCADRDVELVPYEGMSYSCCGLIKPVGGDVQ